VVVSELEVLAWTFHEETEEKKEKCQSGSWLFCRDLNDGPPVYEAGVPPTRPRQIVFNCTAGQMKHLESWAHFSLQFVATRCKYTGK
jgi:hypothetical protein